MRAPSSIVRPGGMPHHLQCVMGRISAVKKGDRQIDNGNVQRAVVNVLTQFISGLGLVGWLALSLEVGERRT